MEKYDVLIIGAGPAGMTAAVYASRTNLKTVFIEKGAPGGKMVTTSKIENWIGDKIVSGADLSLRMFAHAQEFGAEYKYGNVKEVKSNGPQDHVVILESGEEVHTRTVIVGTGMVERIPENIVGIHDFDNKGVSYCATCDGPLYKNRPVGIIGGGDSAIEEALYLSRVASEVHVFVRNKMRAQERLIQELEEKSNVTIHLKTSVKKIEGDNIGMNKVIFDTEGKESTLAINALFPYIGLDPVSDFVKGLGVTDEKGFVITNESMETPVPGIYAIGDIRNKSIRQIATAASDGAIAGKMIANYL